MDSRASYASASKALKDQFELVSKRELHIVEFQTRKRRRGENWPDLAEDLRVLADKPYPDLEEKARERLPLNCYLDFVTDPQISRSV